MDHEHQTGDTLAGGMLRRLLRAHLALCVVFAILTPFLWARKLASLGLGAVLVLGTLVSLRLLNLGKVRAASAVWLTGLTVVLAVLVAFSRGIASPFLAAFIVLASTAYWLLGRRAAVWMSWCVGAMVVGLAALEIAGVRLSGYFPLPPVVTACDFLAILALAMVPLDVVMRELKDSLAVARQKMDEARRTEAEARASEWKYRDLFEHANDMIWCQDLEGRFTAVNEAALRILRMTREDLIGKPVASVVMPEFHEVLRSRQAAQLGGEVLAPEVFGLRTGDGRTAWVEASSRPMTDQRGLPVGLHGIARDITERKRAEEERARLQAELHQAQKLESVGRLAGGVAHDFNNLLTVINGYSQLALDSLPADDPLRKELTQIARAGERATVLTRQLLAFSRKQVLERRVLDLNQVVRGMEPMLARLVGEDVNLSVAGAAANGMVRADPHQLEQVIMNLAVNARDAMPEGGSLRIATANVERSGVWVALVVSDTGMGMDDATRLRIFEPFFTTKESGRGTGLGLSMVQGIVEQSGGTIEVESAPGRGTAFHIFLPAMEAEAEAERAADGTAQGGPETVLVVEDQAEVRHYAVKILRDHGYRVVEAGDAGEALRLCGQERIHLVLTDVVMPVMGGRELADRLEEMQPGIRVVFMSGYTDDVVLRHGVTEERVHFIAKPFSPEVLAGRVRAALETPAAGA